MILNDYLNLIPSQHRNKPKFIDWMSVNLQPYVDISNLMANMYTYFDIDTAIGKQLDILGQKIGRGRILNFQPTGGASPILIDDDYRFLLKARIIQNNWKGSIGEIYDMWDILFPDKPIIIKDNQNMSMDVTLIGSYNQIKKDMVTNSLIIPKSQGVRINIIYAEPPVFAFDLEDDIFKGYNEGDWAELF